MIQFIHCCIENIRHDLLDNINLFRDQIHFLKSVFSFFFQFDQVINFIGIILYVVTDIFTVISIFTHAVDIILQFIKFSLILDHHNFTGGTDSRNRCFYIMRKFRNKLFFLLICFNLSLLRGTKFFSHYVKALSEVSEKIILMSRKCDIKITFCYLLRKYMKFLYRFYHENIYQYYSQVH